MKTTGFSRILKALWKIARSSSTESNSREEMDEKISIFFIVLLIIAGLMMVAVQLICYARLFRDLFCRSKNRSKRRHRANSQREIDDDANRVAIPMNDITQGESMPTESEKI